MSTAEQTPQPRKPKRKRGWSRWHPAVLPLLWGSFGILAFYATGWLLEFVYFVLPFQAADVQSALLIAGRAGLLAGGVAWLQRLTLQAGYGVQLRGWIRATIVGSFVAAIINNQFLPLISWNIGIIPGSVLSSALLATIVALTQWGVLRRTSRRAWAWLPVQIGLAATTLGITLVDGGQTLRNLQPLLLTFITGAVSAGAMLWIQDLIALPRRRHRRAEANDESTSAQSQPDVSHLRDADTATDTTPPNAQTTPTANRANWS